MSQNRKEMTDEELTEDIQESIEQALDGESAFEEEVRDVFNDC